MIDMTTRPVPTTITARPRTGRHPGLARRVVGGFYLSMGGVHVGIVAVDPAVYRSFADAAWCIPALALLVPLARADWQRLSSATSTGR